jgi:hypothetical protein
MLVVSNWPWLVGVDIEGWKILLFPELVIPVDHSSILK